MPVRHRLTAERELAEREAKRGPAPSSAPTRIDGGQARRHACVRACNVLSAKKSPSEWGARRAPVGIELGPRPPR